MSITKHLGLAAALAGTAVALVPAAASAAPLPPLPNLPPHAEFTAAPNPAVLGRVVPGLGARVDLNAAGSYDLDGQLVKYEWDLDGDGTYDVTRPTPTYQAIFRTAGNRQVKLRVTDNRGARASAVRTVVVHRRPIARVAATPAAALLGESVLISAATSTDDGAIVKYEFDLDNNGTYETNNGASPSLTRSYGSVGNRTVGVRVTDNHGVTDTGAGTFVVHRTPTASLAVAPTPAVAGSPVTFDGSGSTDDAAIAKYEFDLDGNGSFETNSGASPTATTTYAAPQTLTVGMRVTDAHGVTDVTSRSLTVNEAPATPPASAASILTGSTRASRRGAVKVKLACPAGTPGGCTGKVKLSKLGSASYRLAAGEKRKVTVQLSAKKLRRLKRAGAIASTATAKAAGRTSVSRAVTVLAPRR